MGIDFLDLQFRVERVFQIKLDRTEFFSVLAARSMDDKRFDLRVIDFVSWVESHVKEQKPDFQGDIFEVLQQEIAYCLCVKESEVTPDAWMVRDLGME